MILNLAEKMQYNFHETYEITDLKDMLYKSVEKFGERIAFKLKNYADKIYKVSYSKFKEDVVSLGTKLIDLGLAQKKIAVIGKNSYEWAVSYMAACILGVVVPIDKELYSKDVVNFLNISEASCVLGDDKSINSILELKSKIENQDTIFVNFNSDKDTSDFLSLKLLKEEGSKLVKDGNNSFDQIKIKPDELHFLLFTSGTTGNAKGVCLSHKNICSNIMSVFGIVKVKPTDQVLSILPIHHTYECTLGYLLVIYSGGCIAYCDGLRYINKNFIEYKPTVVLSVPLLLEKIYKKIENEVKTSLPKYAKNENFIANLPFPIDKIVRYKVKKSLGGKIRAFIVGAAPLNPDLVTAFDKLSLRTLQGYGLTECSPLVAGNNDFYSNPNSVGLPIPNVEYKIDNPNENGIGEIIVKGPNVMLGYYNMPKETNKVLKDSWFYTGDLGKIDAQGWLYITGRKKTVIITKNGENIYPEEIEQLLNDTDFISECLVTGIQKQENDETFVHAQILPDYEAIGEKLNINDASKEEIYNLIKDTVSLVNSQIPNFKHIKSFNIRETDFEKTTTQKIKRYGNNLKIED